MEWGAGVSEREPLKLWFKTPELIEILERSVQQLEQNRGRGQFGGFGSRLEEEEWLRRRRVNIERLRHSGEAQHYMMLAPADEEA